MSRFSQSGNLKLMVFLLAYLGLLSAMTLSLVQASASEVKRISTITPTTLSIVQSNEVTATAVQLIESPAHTPSPTSPPTCTALPTLTLTVSATPTLKPHLGVIWSQEAAAVYLRESPNGRVKVPLPNGMAVQLLDEWVEKDGLTWVKVVAFFPNANPAGWVAEKLILLEASIPRENVVAVQAEEGAYLRSEPGGRVITFLWNGTILEAGESQTVQERRWVHVRVPDGTEGWVAEELLGQPDGGWRQP
jgi:hypothetical protein